MKIDGDKITEQKPLISFKRWKSIPFSTLLIRTTFRVLKSDLTLLLNNKCYTRY